MPEMPTKEEAWSMPGTTAEHKAAEQVGVRRQRQAQGQLQVKF